MSTCDSIYGELKDKSQEDRKESIGWIKKRLYEIDNLLFDSKRYLNEGIRFWFEEYRYVVFYRF